MTKKRTQRIVATLIGLALALIMNNMPAMAAHEPLNLTFASPAKLPPLPAETPRVAPDPTLGSHRHGTWPTTTEKWIDVDLSEQRVVAYEGTKPRRAFTVSTGLPNTPTRDGEFRIWVKTRIQDMDGGSKETGTYYYLPDVEWVQYFDGEIGFHGTYWHENFGQPMSRGCVNMTNEDARWLFEWAGPYYDLKGAAWQSPSESNLGTLVVVHE
jgi:lipoprotein-anchoring transpeptidase ErfK/SrfK